MKGRSMTRGCCSRRHIRRNHRSGYSDPRMQDSQLRRPMSDGPLLVQCI